jgi:1-deoxy-D-xylulose-5-phosphate reductoisomerase
MAPAPEDPISVSLVGSTGSIGTQTLDVVRANPGRFRIEALAAHRSVDALLEQVWEFRPRIVAMGDDDALTEIRDRLPAGTELVGGPSAYGDIAGEADVCVNGVVGFAGLPVTINALRRGRRLALANKESLITAGPVVRAVLAAPGAGEIVPVDSEHCAIHQCLSSHRFAQGIGGPDRLRRLVLTASGGPFRVRAREAGGGAAARAALAGVTRAEALNHPTWKMGPKITIDSSTLFNKGLEVIEARELFDVDVDRIDVVVHPQSVIHSMAEFTDGTTMAQLSMPDMRLPIAYALAYPDRVDTAYGAMDWTTLSRLDFETPDTEAFPCLAMAYEAGRRGGVVPAWINAANEVAVDAFLRDEISWGDIFVVIEASLLRADSAKPLSVVDVIDADRSSRAHATELVASLHR